MTDFFTSFIPVYMIIVSAIAFFAYGIDKRKARKNRWRIPEKFLLGICLAGGFVGGFLGMQVFHHKTKPRYSYAVVIVSAALWGFGLFKLYFN